MGRPGLDKHPKFRRLVHMLSVPRSHVRGYLECMWETTYETGDPVLGDETDVELAADWPGQPGLLVKALSECGGSRPGFIESVDSRWQVHDLFDHAPDYVTNRRNKEDERKKVKYCDHCSCEFHSTERHAKYCNDTCRVAAFRVRNCHDSVTNGNEALRNGNEPVTDGNERLRAVTPCNEPPAPAPAPAPLLKTDPGVPGSLSDKKTEQLIDNTPKALLRLMTVWNVLKGIQPFQRITKKRRAAFGARAATEGWMESVRPALDKVRDSDFCHGRNDRNWLADVDWFLRPDTVVRLLEGKYDNRNGHIQDPRGTLAVAQQYLTACKEDSDAQE